MSPRAACRLETLGFRAVYDYTAGKSDWLAAGLPTEGPSSATPRPGHLARTPVPTCGFDETVATARERAMAAGEDRCVVVSERGVVLGVLDAARLAGDEDAIVQCTMREGPPAVRAHEELGALLDRMNVRESAKILVTDPDGRLVGMLHRDDVAAALDRQHRSRRGPGGAIHPTV
ncbi:MAG: CBS domain-containing protein [Actinomycetota bacterium]|nr:CBS domain-containing protein [Actinomycetota bacterium]